MTNHSPLTATPQVTIVGAGIVGVCSAVWLQRAGYQVTLIDRDEPGKGASFGNAANISPGQVVPYAMPGLLRDVPRWLLSRRSPFKIRPAYALKIAPWLWAWNKAGHTENAIRVSRAMRTLHAQVFDLYSELLRGIPATEFFERCGHLYVSEGVAKARTSELAGLMREAAGVRVDHVSNMELRDIEPTLSSRFKSGLWMPNNGRCKNPYRLTQALAEQAVRQGATILQADVKAIVIKDGRCRAIVANGNEHPLENLVIAAGIGSRPLADQLASRIPLETERGYHVTIHDPQIRPRAQIVVRDWGIGAGPIDDDLRVAGTVEFCGVGASPDWTRADRLLIRAKELFPAINIKSSTRWMGERPSTSDGLAVLGRSPVFSNVFFAFGNGHHGMTAAPMMGKVVGELVSNRPTSIDIHPFRPERFQ